MYNFAMEDSNNVIQQQCEGDWPLDFVAKVL